MKEQLLISVDLGTSFIKVGVYADSKCIVSNTEPVKDYRPKPGVFIQKGEELFSSVIACLKKAVAQIGDRSSNVEAISFTGQMSGFMGVSKDWEDITTWSCSLDSRYMPYAQKQMAYLKDTFLKTAGTNFPQMAPKYEWFKSEFSEESKKIVKYLMVSSYVIGKLGEMSIEEAIIDRSYISWTGLSDVRNDMWSDKICSAINLEKKFLPKIVNSNHICGQLADSMAKTIGLKAGIPLVSGAGDKIAGCLGAGIVNLGDMIFEGGSYGEISCCTDEYRPDTEESRLDVLSSAIPGEFFMTHFVAGSGITFDWFIDTFLLQKKNNIKSIFQDIEKKASEIPPGSDGVMAIGLLGGSSMPLDGTIRGIWIGHNWSHKIEHFYRSLMESFTFDFALAMKSIDRLYPEYKNDIPVKMIGGGAKSALWMQMFADVTGKKFCGIDRQDAAMWGAAILAGNAVGIFGDLKETACKHVAPSKEYRPNHDLTEIYTKYIDLYKNTVLGMRPFYKTLQNI